MSQDDADLDHIRQRQDDRILDRMYEPVHDEPDPDRKRDEAMEEDIWDAISKGDLGALAKILPK